MRSTIRGIGPFLAVATIAALASCCDGKSRVETETHFISCQRTSECAELGSSFACVDGRCKAEALPDTGAGGHAGSDGSGSASGGGGSMAWQGAPCAECNLQAQIPALADAASEDCGTISRDGTGRGGDCAHAALAADRAFTLIVEENGTDSIVRTAWIFVAGRLYAVSYDSNVCGGVESCESEGCGPHISSSTCVDPVASAAPMTVFECGSRTTPQTICGPPP